MRIITLREVSSALDMFDYTTDTQTVVAGAISEPFDSSGCNCVPVLNTYGITANLTVTDNETIADPSEGVLPVLGSSIDDETGSTFGGTNNRCSYVDGLSWFDQEGFDASAHASMGRVVIRVDSAGKTAWGYIGAAGTGETLSATEKTLNGNFSAWTGDNPNNWTVASEDASNYITEDSGKARVVSNNTAAVGMTQEITGLTAGALYLDSFDLAINTLGWRELVHMPSGTVYVAFTNRTDHGTLTRHFTQVGTSIKFYFYRNNTGASDYTIDNKSYKQVITPSATGAWIYKDPNLTECGWNIESGFNYADTSYTFDIYQPTYTYEEYYTETVSLIRDSIKDWWDYYFAPRRTGRDVVFYFEQRDNTTAVITISYPGGNAKCGFCKPGIAVESGKTKYGIDLEITDYSIIDTNDFGVSFFDVGAWAKRADAEIIIQNSELDAVHRTLIANRGKGLVVDFNKYSTAISAGHTSVDGIQNLIIYGYTERFTPSIDRPYIGEYGLEIQGLI